MRLFYGRQREVLELAAQGYSRREIGQMVGMDAGHVSRSISLFKARMQAEGRQTPGLETRRGRRPGPDRVRRMQQLSPGEVGNLANWVEIDDSRLRK